MKSKQDLKKLYQEKINHFRKLHHIHVKGTDIPDPIDTWDKLKGTIHILRKHFHSTKLNLTSKFFTKTGFFRQNKRISFSTLHFDEFFML